MKLHVLSVVEMLSARGAPSSVTFVEASDRLFLLDCGPTDVAGHERAGLNPSDVDAIILSHLHGDHSAAFRFSLSSISIAASGHR